MLLSSNELLVWMLIVGMVAIALMGFDKSAAKLRKSRIRESSLWLVALAGGFAGVILGAVLFHHKVSKVSFWPPVILATILWLLAIVYLS